MADAQLFDDTFEIKDINHKKYDRVARVTGVSQDGQVSMTLDVHTELYPISPGETVNMALATTLSMDGTKDERGYRDLARSGDATLADLYDYVCRGKVYRMEEKNDGQDLKVFISFGGLLLYLEGPYRRLTQVKVEYVYMLMKK